MEGSVRFWEGLEKATCERWGEASVCPSHVKEVSPSLGQAERDRKWVKDRQGYRSRIRKGNRGTSNVGLDHGTSQRRKGGQDSAWSSSEGKRGTQGKDAREVTHCAVRKNSGACESPSSLPLHDSGLGKRFLQSAKRYFKFCKWHCLCTSLNSSNLLLYMEKNTTDNIIKWVWRSPSKTTTQKMDPRFGVCLWCTPCRQHVPYISGTPRI